MKKLLLSIFAITSTSLFSQTIPNAGFENWYTNTESGSNYQVPQNWIAFDLFDRAFNSNYTGSAVTKTTQSHTGASAALMQTVISGGDTATGLLVSVNTLNELMNGLFGGSGMGFTCAQRPANLTGFYKMTSINGDFAMASVVLTKWNSSLNVRDTVAIGSGSTTTATSVYASFSVPIVYTLNLFPDTALIIMGLQSTANNTSVGSLLFVDDLAFTGSVPFGIEQYTEGKAYSAVYPNPLSSSATISIDPSVNLTNGNILVYDILGNEVKRFEKVGPETILKKDDLREGVYFYNVFNEGTLLSCGKFVIE